MNADAAFVWALILGLTVGAFLTRAVFILPGERLKLSAGFERLLRFAPAAALMAIVMPDIAALDGVLVLSFENPRLVAGMVAFVVAAATRNIMATIGAGLVALALSRAWTG